MRAADFEAMVHRMVDGIPEEYLAGIAEVRVSPKTVPHPVRADIYTLGECIPLPVDDPDPETIQSRVVLYHGSFQALSQVTANFDWREEAWDTLTHELRHHLEWRARVPDLEAFDAAAEANFARHDGEPYDPLFFLDGERVAPDTYKVDDDFFLDRRVARIPASLTFTWHGRTITVIPPPALTLPAFLTIEEVPDPPPGDLVLVLRRSGGLRALAGLFRKPGRGDGVYQATLPGAVAEGGSTA